MASPTAPSARFFGDFCLEPRGLFRRDERGAFIAIALGSRALAVLSVLTDRAGDLVSRDELMAAAWPRTVVEYSNLAVQIAALRRVLDLPSEDRRFIQTVAGRGYRFVVPVTLGDALPAMTPGQVSNGVAKVRTAGEAFGNSEAAQPAKPLQTRIWRHAWLKTLAAAPVVLAATIVWLVAYPHMHRQFEVHEPPRLSIAVLPFVNLSASGEQPQFAQAIADDLTNDLSQVSDLVVIPFDTRVKARDLGARYVLEGSAQWSGERVRTNAWVIDAESGASVWARQIVRDAGDNLALESEISGQLTASLRYALVNVEAIRPTGRSDAWGEVLRGRAVLYNPSSRQNYSQAALLFERALELNPQLVEAKLYLAMTFTGRVLDEMSDDKRLDLDHAQSLIEQAQAAAPRSPIAHFAAGQLLRARGHCDDAMTQYEAVLASDRNWLAALSHLGRCKTYLGRVDEAIALQQRVVQLSSPDDSAGITYFRLGEAYMLRSHPGEAIPWLQKARAAQPHMGYVHGFLASAYALEQQPERAASELAEARRLTPWRYSRIATERAVGQELGVSQNDALWGTLLGGLRKAGVPD